MFRVKKKFILIFVLMLAIISVICALKTVTYSATQGSLRVADRAGTVIYLNRRQTVSSYGGDTRGGGPLIWLDVMEIESLLCCDYDGMIPGRGNALDFSFKAVDGGGVPIFFGEFEDAVKATKDYVVNGASYTYQLNTVKVTKEDWLKVFESESNPYGATREYMNNSYSYYTSAGFRSCSPMEAYILSEIGRGGELQVEIKYKANGDFEYHESTSYVHTSSGVLVDSYGQLGERVTVYYGSSHTDTISSSQYAALTSKAGHAGYHANGNGTYSSTSYGDAFIKNPKGDGYIKVTTYSYGANIQIAWWATVAGGSGGGGNALSEEASLFEAYYNRMGGTYKPQWIIDGDCKDVYVYKDQTDGSSIAGPFAIDYVEAHAQVGSRPYVQFAGITDYEVYTDASSEPLKLGEDFEFIWVDGQRTEAQNKEYKFPKPNERFYIKLKYIEDASKITDMKVSFRYMKASGTYESLNGKYIELYFICRDASFTLGELGELIDESVKHRFCDAGGGVFITPDEIMDFLRNNGSYTFTRGGGSLPNFYSALQENRPEFNIESHIKQQGLHYTVYSSKYYQVKKNFVNANYTNFSNYVGAQGEEETDEEYAARKVAKQKENAGNYFDRHNKQGYRLYVGEEADKRVHFMMVFAHVKAKDTPRYSQKLCWAGAASKWYEFCELHRSISLDTSKVRIYKDLVNDEGEKINEVDPNRTFKFYVKVSGSQNDFDTVVEVKPGEYVDSPTVYWKNDGTIPTYEVREIIEGGDYELVKISSTTGNLQRNKAVSIYAENKIRRTGKIRIKKKIEETQLWIEPESSLENRTFKFRVTVKGNFKYIHSDGTVEKHTDSSMILENVEITGAGEWISNDIIWYGEDEPTYEVEEIQEYGFETISVTPSKGKLANGNTATVTVKNGYLEEHGKLAIEKRLSLPEGETRSIDELYSTDEIMGLEFFFKIKIDSSKKEIVKKNDNEEEKREESIEQIVKLTALREDGDYVWRYTSDDYVWIYGNAPEFTVEEMQEMNPKGTSFKNVSVVLDNGTPLEYTQNGSKVTGKLVAEENNIPTVICQYANEIDRKHSNAKILITKQVKAVTDLEEENLLNKNYFMRVTLDGKFDYSGKSYKDNSYRLSNIKYTDESKSEYEILAPENIDILGPNDDGYEDAYVLIKIENNSESTWESENIEWYGDESPEYKVEEHLQGEKVQHTVQPGSGKLSDAELTGNKINVLVENRSNEIPNQKAGYLKIIKKLDENEHPELCTNDYIKSLEFKFSVNVEEHPEFIVTLDKDNARYDENSRVWYWEWISDKFMWDGDNGPEYTIKEINFPEGVTFKSFENAESNSGTNEITGHLIEGEVNAGEIVTTDVTAINHVPEYIGNLVISKAITQSALEEQEFTFNVKLKGSFIYNEKEYNNEELIIPVVIKGAGKSDTIEVKWYGSKEGPEYYVNEVRPIREKNSSGEEEQDYLSNNISSIVKNGVLLSKNAFTNVVEFVNEPEYYSGYLKIRKEVNSTASPSQSKYKFKVTVGNDDPYYVTLKANETYTSEMYKWYKVEEAPKYSVEEIDIPSDVTNVEPKIIDGELKEGIVEEVTITNTLNENKGRFKIIKKAITEDKYESVKDATFDVEVTITGTFQINGRAYYEDSAKINGLSISEGKPYTSPEIIWWGDNAPSITVDEIELPEGWFNVGISNNRATLGLDNPLEIIVSNKFDLLPHIDLALSLEGDVWEDEKTQNGKEVPKADGIKNAGELGIDGVEVYIYDENGELTTIYEDIDNGIMSQPIITSGGGHWKAPRLKLTPSGRYNVKFVYDGQTYEATKFLATSNGNAQTYINAPTNRPTGDTSSKLYRSDFANDSMAKEIDRKQVDEKMAKISGKTAIDGYGETEGIATGVGESTNELHYKSNESIGGLRKSSELQTVDEAGNVYDLFKASADTLAGGLSYPFDDKIFIDNKDATLSIVGNKDTDVYLATYEYCKHINLGLVRRNKADLGATKYLETAKIEVNGMEPMKYTFNTLADINRDYYSRQLDKDAMGQEFNLGLYSTGYYYRAEMYQTNAELMDLIQGYNAETKQIVKNMQSIKDQEMKLELTYKMELYNESQQYKVKINSINDYVDETLGMPIKTLIRNSNSGNEEWTEIENAKWKTEKLIKGSDGVTYRQISLDLDEDILLSGEKIEVLVTFEVIKEDAEGVKDAVSQGKKANLVELSAYTTYYQYIPTYSAYYEEVKDDSKYHEDDGIYDGEIIAGIIDRDSAPDNINVLNYNDKEWYEDDTDSSPILELTVVEDEREITGTVWEDKKENESSNGNGREDIENVVKEEDKEARISGLTIELVEKVKLGDTEYDFIWPTHKQLDCLGGLTLEQLTGFDSTIESYIIPKEEPEGAEQEEPEEQTVVELKPGEYRFSGVPSGDYVVRFLYGNNKLDLEDTFAITGEPYAVKEDGTPYNEIEENAIICTANYDDEMYGYTPAVYNGHDFKSTIYQVDLIRENTNEQGYLTNKFHDLNAEKTDERPTSIARDSEIRRLELISKSETIKNTNSELLNTANSYTANHNELYKEYNMFADTAILRLDTLQSAKAVDTQTKTTIVGVNTGGAEVQEKEILYTITGIDFGLVERPETNLVLDKQIKEIKITTNDRKVIFDANYEITYDLEDEYPADKTLIAKVGNQYLVANKTLTNTSIGIDVLQAIDKVENKLIRRDAGGISGTQFFRFINVDDDIIQGATIEIEYQYTALNVGEIDYTSKILEDIPDRVIDKEDSATSVKTEIEKLINQKSEEELANITEIGKYIGSYYYTGEPGLEDTVVSTRVRQIVDYIDNDATFTAVNNSENNHSWRNTSISELQGNGKEEEVLVGKTVIPEFDLIDIKGVRYITNQKNNIVLSVDDLYTAGKDNAQNNEFESKLLPIKYVKDNLDKLDIGPYSSSMKLTITKTVGTAEEADDMAFDNVGEIVIIENTVGRRDMATTVGNTDPKGPRKDDPTDGTIKYEGEFAGALKERDSSATELITFTPPTGTIVQKIMEKQSYVVVIIALAVLAIGVIIIKKKVTK